MKDLVEKYLELINTEFKGLNLTRVVDYDEFYHKQINDSLIPYESSSILKKIIEETKLVLDVGFGGGFPLIPLAYKHPGVSFCGIEARAKKANAVQKISENLGLKNIITEHLRIEDLFIDIPCIINFKAVGNMVEFLSKIRCNEEVYAVFYKGPNVYDLETVNIANWELVEVIEYKLENGFGDRRAFVYKSKKSNDYNGKRQFSTMVSC